MEPKTITLPKTRLLIFEYSILSLAFFIPLFIAKPQLLTGTIVNTLLFLFMSQTHSKRIIPLVILPSIGALFNGVLFGTFTTFLVVLLPFIWMSNYLLVRVFSTLLKHNSFLFSVLISSFLKSGFLFVFSLLLVNIKVLPELFLTAMGIFQLYTAVMGGILAYIIHFFLQKKYD